MHLQCQISPDAGVFVAAISTITSINQDSRRRWKCLKVISVPRKHGISFAICPQTAWYSHFAICPQRVRWQWRKQGRSSGKPCAHLCAERERYGKQCFEIDLCHGDDGGRDRGYRKTIIGAIDDITMNSGHISNGNSVKCSLQTLICPDDNV